MTHTRKSILIGKLKNTLLLPAICLAFQAHAADTALLIGVGQHTNENLDLPGIGLDIESMKRTATNLGYENIISILDKDATEEKIIQTLKYLQSSLTKSDRFLFYFSGHGTRIPDFNGDETVDHADEVLVAANARADTFEGKDTLDGVIVDDELSTLLKGFKTQHTLAFIDACNSGTVTSKGFLDFIGSGSLVKNGASSGKKKMWSWPGMPTSTEQFKAFEIEAEENTNGFVSISAAGDTEYAIATSEGSIFTLALQAAVTKRINKEHPFQSKPLTPSNLRSFAEDYIVKRVSPKELFTPQLAGNERLYDKELVLHVPYSNGPNWQKLDNLVQKNELKMSSPTKILHVGDYLNSDITIPLNATGYLNIVQVDSRDNVNVLYPNQYNKDNRIALKKGKFNIKEGLRNFKIKAAADPLGDAMLLAFFTSNPINLYASSNNERDGKGELLDVIVQASEKGFADLSKALVVVKDDTHRSFSYAGKIQLTIKP